VIYVPLRERRFKLGKFIAELNGVEKGLACHTIADARLDRKQEEAVGCQFHTPYTCTTL
jgi:hypothetical protein